MKRLLKSWVFWAFVVAPPLAALLLLSVRVETRSACGDCLSGRIQSRWLLLIADGMTVPLTGTAEGVEESHGFRDLLSGPHEHRWRSREEAWTSIWGKDRTPYPAALIFTLSIGDEIFTPTPPLLRDYERDAAFREFVRGKLQRGDLTREDARAILALSDLPEPVDSRKKELVARRNAWREEFPAADWGFAGFR